MDWTRVEGNWKQMRGRVKERWGKLTDDDLTAIAGRRDQLEGMIQERYGYARERARREIEDWYRSMEPNLSEQIEIAPFRHSKFGFDCRSHRQTADASCPRKGNRRDQRGGRGGQDGDPLSALGIALGLGFLIGVFMRR